MKAMKFVSVLSAVSLIVALTSCSSSKDAGSSVSPSGGGSGSFSKLTTIRVELSQDASALDVLVGVERGFFKSRGLDVKPIFVANGTTVPQVVGSEYEIASITVTQLILAASNGLSLMAVSANRVDTPDNPTYSVIARPDSGIKTVKDLEGKTVGTPFIGSGMMLTTEQTYKNQGGDLSDIKWLAGPNAQLPDLLKSKRFDAITALEPYRSQLIAEGYTDLGDTARVLGDAVSAAVYVSTKSWATSHSKQVKSWLAALTEADDYIKANPDAAKQILISKANISAASVQSSELSTYQAQLPEGIISAWADLMQSVGVLKKPVNGADLTYSAG